MRRLRRRVRWLLSLDWPTLRGAWWAMRSVRRVRRDLARLPVAQVRLAAPRGLPPGAGRGVAAVLRRLHPSCLERSLVLQRWLAAHGDPREVVIGVTAPGPGFRAHAWLEGERWPEYVELTRVKP